jgi:predicted NBD/HSP70 family sugar kinase
MSDLASPASRSLSEILRMIAEGRARSRTEIARVSGLARSTVTQRVNALLARDLVVEDELAESSGGRPPVGLRLNRRAGLLLAADIGATHLRVAVADLSADVINEHASAMAVADGPDVVLPQVTAIMAGLIEECGRSTSDVRGIGVAVPGPVQFKTGTVIRPPIMPGWDGVEVPRYFANIFNAPVLVDNDVNAMAIAEYQARHSQGELLLFIYIGTGIGCGIVDDGQVHRGADGAAGDIGHIRLLEADAVCSCGNIGCVEAVASGSALARELSAAGLSARTSSDVVALAQAGNPVAMRAVRVASTRVGAVVATLVNCYNPSIIVIGGPLSPLKYDLLAGIRSVVYQRATALATRALTIEASQLDERVGVIGALLLAHRHVFSAKGLQRLMATGEAR